MNFDICILLLKRFQSKSFFSHGVINKRFQKIKSKISVQLLFILELLIALA